MEMTKEAKSSLIWMCGYFFVALVSGISCYLIGVGQYKAQAIERGFAEYDSVTGVWQWKDDGGDLVVTDELAFGKNEDFMFYYDPPEIGRLELKEGGAVLSYPKYGSRSGDNGKDE